MSSNVENASIIKQKDVPIESKLSRVLLGLDPEFALRELTNRQGPMVRDRRRAREVLEQHYGLLGNQPKTFAQIGRERDLNKETVRRIQLNALFAIRTLRLEYSPERVFERDGIFGLDNAFLYSDAELKRIAVRWPVGKITYEYPAE